jgi:phospholipid/cholesterol/gamma-HCH transport system substrate-binding protein
MSEKPRKPQEPRKVEGYWKSLEVKRDPEREAQRWQRIKEAAAARKARLAEAEARGPGRAHERVGRQLRGRVRDAVAAALLIVLGLATTLYILGEQRAALPSWVPLFGQEFFEFEAEFRTGQAITPGQGQAVMVSGVEVGKIDSVHVEDGRAIVGLKVEPKYEPLLREDAELLIRPRTQLNDMVIEVDPGESPTALEEGERIPLEQTEPNVQPDEFLAMLDGDTRDYLTLLLQGGAEGLRDRGEDLSQAFRRIAPFSRHVARLNTAIAKRRDALAGSIHAFRQLATELGRHNSDLAEFVSASGEALAGFANQSESIRESLRRLPNALAATRGALEDSNELALAARPALDALTPQARELGPALTSSKKFFERTKEPIRTKLRPFVEETKPVLRHTAQLADPLANTVRDFGDALGLLNYGFNELAYNPGQKKPGFLFYLPWLNHNLNSSFAFQDAFGPFRRALVMVSCNSTHLAHGFVGTKPLLKTVYQATNVPTPFEICPEENWPTPPGP